ncbi:MAG: peptidoglycan editing factor PgeF [Nitrospinaceae bacterium]|nr:peptidoglycan editing factor PgeF [Nitrospinaceae bacterium]
MIASFFVKSLQNQPSLVHGTSPRFYEIEKGKRESFCPPENDNGGLFRQHQKLFLQSLGIEKENLFRVKQVHGNRVYVLKDSKVFADEVSHQEADAIVTHLPDCPVMILTADCVPIIIYDPVKHVVGVVHAGRVGTLKRIFSNAIETFSREYGSRPSDMVVSMGPAIGGCCYEVDEQCALPFIERSSVNSRFVRKARAGKFFIDLPEANRLEGSEAGILKENIYTDGPCTSCENHRWYSYRKEGKTGRLMTLAMLRQRK